MIISDKRTANALHDMRRAFRLLSNSIQVKDGKLLSTQELPKRFHVLSKSMDDIVPALWELTIFNSDLSFAFLSLKAAAESAKRYLETEYNLILFREYPIDGFLNDVLWGSFTAPLETVVRELSHLADRHIQALHTSQERNMAKFLHLTTIATFLSSVTATTLQISFGDQPSALSSATNTFWFCSLVFSIGSAMHSLLAMTWNQSDVRPTEAALPPWLYKWFHKGPITMLVLSGITFSIGLCLLAYGLNQDLATPVITTIFATIITAILFLLSGFFVKNQKLHRYKNNTPGNMSALQEPIGRWRSARRLAYFLRRTWIGFTHTMHRFSSDMQSSRDAELGPPDSPTESSFPTSYPMLNKSQAFSIHSTAAISSHYHSPIKCDDADWTMATVPAIDSSRHQASFVQFSANGKLLVTLNSVTIVHPDGGEIEQVSWNPLYQMLEEQKLLTRSGQTICIWAVDECLIVNHKYSITVDAPVSAVQWSHKEISLSN
ncbi:hypothetical protein SCHPADRAFT_74929 [Schizopora paradoxa]|uniref:Uncharacterized protein n=1 Tax=Schizopora paradoxa TaxID=27342 RepID=A0A0H2SCC6_9AGAM|nr:hypothetical protein SCHPADRAFT_74929 [Schizopora paradoxa]